MNFIQTRIPDVVIFEPTVFEDERGWFLESFNEKRFREGLRALGQPIPRSFVQDNHSLSKKGVLRGLHYQIAPHQQGKLVRVTHGAAFDVAVDVRENSETFGQWEGVEISASNRRILWLPEGFAHGFLALEDNTQFHYKTTDYYARECEAEIRWDDPELSIEWPKVESLIVNQKDAAALLFSRRLGTAE